MIKPARILEDQGVRAVVVESADDIREFRKIVFDFSKRNRILHGPYEGILIGDPNPKNDVPEDISLAEPDTFPFIAKIDARFIKSGRVRSDGHELRITYITKDHVAIIRKLLDLVF